MPFWKKMFNKRQGVYYPRAVVQGKPVDKPLNDAKIGGRFIFIPHGKSRRNHTISARQRSEVGSAAGRRNGVADTGANCRTVSIQQGKYQ